MESQLPAKKRRGPYRQYYIDPTLPIPKTTRWRMSKSGTKVSLDASFESSKDSYDCSSTPEQWVISWLVQVSVQLVATKMQWVWVHLTAAYPIMVSLEVYHHSSEWDMLCCHLVGQCKIQVLPQSKLPPIHPWDKLKPTKVYSRSFATEVTVGNINDVRKPHACVFVVTT